MSAIDLFVTDTSATENTTYASSNITDGSSKAAEAEADDYYGYSLYQIPSWIFVICAILAIGALLFATIAMIFICVYRKKPIVTMAQPSTYYAVMDTTRHTSLTNLSHPHRFLFLFFVHTIYYSFSPRNLRRRIYFSSCDTMFLTGVSV